MIDVLVAGAGPAGLACALGFAARGYATEIVEAAPSARTHGRLFMLNWPALRLLEQLVPQRLSRLAIARMRVFAPSGKPFEFSTSAAQMGALAATVAEDELLAALHAAAAEAGVAPRFSERIDALARKDDCWIAQCGKRKQRTRLVIAADGAESATAALAGLPQLRQSPPARIISGWLKAPAAPSAAAWQWFGREGVVALLPAGGNRFNFIWSLPAHADDPPADDLERSLHQVCSQEVGAISVYGTPACFEVRPAVGVHAAHRVAAVGDSATVVHPLVGQGLSLALGDVAVLLSCCADCKDPGLLARLMRYRRLRRLRAEAISKLACALAPRADRAIDYGTLLLEAASLLDPKSMLAAGSAIVNAP